MDSTSDGGHPDRPAPGDRPDSDGQPGNDGRPGNDDGPVPAERICSARGCRHPATYALDWNNPKLHTPDRRKTWLACDEHRGPLSDFLAARDFLRDVTALA